MADSKKNDLKQEVEQGSFKVIANALGIPSNVNRAKGMVAEMNNSTGEKPAIDSRANAGAREGNDDIQSNGATDMLFEATMITLEPAHGLAPVFSETATAEVIENNDNLAGQKEKQQETQHLQKLTSQNFDIRRMDDQFLKAAGASPECRPQPGASHSDDDENENKFSM